MFKKLLTSGTSFIVAVGIFATVLCISVYNNNILFGFIAISLILLFLGVWFNCSFHTQTKNEQVNNREITNIYEEIIPSKKITLMTQISWTIAVIFLILAIIEYIRTII